jgi:hypothetical protein
MIVYVVSNDRMNVNDELERLWKESFVVHFKTTCQHFHRGTEENFENPQ